MKTKPAWCFYLRSKSGHESITATFDKAEAEDLRRRWQREGAATGRIVRTVLPLPRRSEEP